MDLFQPSRIECSLTLDIPARIQAGGPRDNITQSGVDRTGRKRFQVVLVNIWNIAVSASLKCREHAVADRVTSEIIIGVALTVPVNRPARVIKHEVGRPDGDV